jgi:hypothetical protein
MPASNPTISTFAGLAPPWSLSNLDTNFSNVAALLASVNTYTQYVVDTGAANAYVCTFGAGVATTLAAGLGVCFKASASNTTATTLNVGGTGIKNVLTPDGAALLANQILSGGIYYAIYDGTNYILLNPSTASVTFTATQTGFTAATTYNFKYTKSGNQVTLNSTGQISGTSNSVAKGVSGVPAVIRPVQAIYFTFLTQDNGAAFVASSGFMNTDGTMSFFATANDGVFTNSGTAQIRPFSISYSLA